MGDIINKNFDNITRKIGPDSNSLSDYSESSKNYLETINDIYKFSIYPYWTGISGSDDCLSVDLDGIAEEVQSFQPHWDYIISSYQKLSAYSFPHVMIADNWYELPTAEYKISVIEISCETGISGEISVQLSTVQLGSYTKQIPSKNQRQWNVDAWLNLARLQNLSRYTNKGYWTFYSPMIYENQTEDIQDWKWKDWEWTALSSIDYHALLEGAFTSVSGIPFGFCSMSLSGLIYDGFSHQNTRYYDAPLLYPLEESMQFMTKSDDYLFPRQTVSCQTSGFIDYCKSKSNVTSSILSIGIDTDNSLSNTWGWTDRLEFTEGGKLDGKMTPPRLMFDDNVKCLADFYSVLTNKTNDYETKGNYATVKSHIMCPHWSKHDYNLFITGIDLSTYEDEHKAFVTGFAKTQVYGQWLSSYELDNIEMSRQASYVRCADSYDLGGWEKDYCFGDISGYLCADVSGNIMLNAIGISGDEDYINQLKQIFPATVGQQKEDDILSAKNKLSSTLSSLCAEYDALQEDYLCCQLSIDERIYYLEGVAVNIVGQVWFSEIPNFDSLSAFENWFSSVPYGWLPRPETNMPPDIWSDRVMTDAIQGIVRTVPGYEEAEVPFEQNAFFLYFQSNPILMETKGTEILQVINYNVQNRHGIAYGLLTRFDTASWRQYKAETPVPQQFLDEVDQMHTHMQMYDSVINELLERMNNDYARMMNIEYEIEEAYAEYRREIQEIEEKEYEVVIPDLIKLNLLWSEGEDRYNEKSFYGETTFTRKVKCCHPEGGLVFKLAGDDGNDFTEWPVQSLKQLAQTTYVGFEREYHQDDQISARETDLSAYKSDTFIDYLSKGNALDSSRYKLAQRAYDRAESNSCFSGSKADYSGKKVDWTPYETSKIVDVVLDGYGKPEILVQDDGWSFNVDLRGAYKAECLLLDGGFRSHDFAEELFQITAKGDLFLSSGEYPEIPPDPNLGWAKGNEKEKIEISPLTIAEAKFSFD